MLAMARRRSEQRPPPPQPPAMAAREGPTLGSWGGRARRVERVGAPPRTTARAPWRAGRGDDQVGPARMTISSFSAVASVLSVPGLISAAVVAWLLASCPRAAATEPAASAIALWRDLLDRTKSLKTNNFSLNMTFRGSSDALSLRDNTTVCQKVGMLPVRKFRSICRLTKL